MTRVVATISLLLALVCSAHAAPATQPAQKPDGVVDPAARVPDEVRNVGIDEKLGHLLPGNLIFTNEAGEDRALSSYFNTGRPLILQLGYFQCPHLCDSVSHGIIDSVRSMNLTAGKDFDMLFISIDPTDTPSLAALKQQSVVQYFGHPEQRAGFHYMVGNQRSIDLIADAVGFRFQEAFGGAQYAHPAAIFIVTPSGALSRTMYGVNFEPKTLRLSLVDASAGKIGTALDKFLLICLHYDSQSQHYTLAIASMRTGGVLTILTLGGTLLWLFRREFHMRAIQQQTDSNTVSEPSKNET